MTESSVKDIKRFKISGKGSAVIRAVFAALIFSSLQLFSQYLFYMFGLDDTTYEGLFNAFYGVFVSFCLCIYIWIIHKPGEEPMVRKSRMIAHQWIMVVIIGLGMVAIVGVYFSIAHYIADLVPKVQESMTDYSDNIARDLPTVDDLVPAWDHILYLISISFLIPVTEEIAFRGIVQGELSKQFSPVASILISGVIFGALHFQPIQIGYAVLCGIAIGAVYYLCDSIWATITIHSIFNLLGSGISQFMDSGVIPGLTEAIKDKISSGIFYAEYLMMLPAITCFIMLYIIHKGGMNKISKEVVNE